jgi:hypothetical protein
MLDAEYYLADEDLAKFPRTYHMPFSPGVTSDDKVHKSLDHFIGKEVIVTEKLDGENTTHTRVKTHARSVDSKAHWSRERMKVLQNELKWKLELPQFVDIHRICGENMVATHSISYKSLPSYFLCFAIWDRFNVCYGWDDMEILCSELDLELVPLLARGIFMKDNKILQADGTIIKLNDLYTGVSKFGGVQEGMVMRVAHSFYYHAYDKMVAKYVRANHVTSDEHWMYQSAVENKLAEK